MKRDSSINDWENPTITGMNKVPGHATLVPFASVAEALAYDEAVDEVGTPRGREASSFVRSLNGEWRFHLS